MKLKVMTYNIMSCRSYQALLGGMAWGDPEIIRPQGIAEVIREEAPDIVCMNEVHEAGWIYGDQPRQLAERCGYPYFYFAQARIDYASPKRDNPGSPYGNAILSKYPILEKNTVLIPAAADGQSGAEVRSAACVTLEMGAKRVTVICSHFGLIESERAAAAETVCRLAEKSEYPCILAGDFNCPPDAAPIARIRQVLTDTMPGEPVQTFIGKESFKSKIDYIFVSSGIAVLDAQVLNKTASDHYPVCCQLEI